MQDYTGQRAKCPECKRTFSLTWDGRYRKHGPRGFECTTSGQVADADDVLGYPAEPPPPEVFRSPLPWRWTDAQWARVTRACREADRRANVGAETLMPSRLMRR